MNVEKNIIPIDNNMVDINITAVKVGDMLTFKSGLVFIDRDSFDLKDLAGTVVVKNKKQIGVQLHQHFDFLNNWDNVVYFDLGEDECDAQIYLTGIDITKLEGNK